MNSRKIIDIYMNSKEIHHENPPWKSTMKIQETHRIPPPKLPHSNPPSPHPPVPSPKRQLQGAALLPPCLLHGAVLDQAAHAARGAAAVSRGRGFEVHLLPLLGHETGGWILMFSNFFGGGYFGMCWVYLDRIYLICIYI